MIHGLALCAGVGGLELGLRLALGSRYRTVCHVEREGFAAATLVARMEDATLGPAPIWDDVRSFDARPWRGVVDLVSAGIPCQPFSAAGKRRHLDDDRWLWSDVARIVSECSPRVVFVENVPGLVRHGLRHVWGDLRAMGYRVEAGFFSAAEVGAPHRRQRVFILADADGGRLSAQWEPKHGSIEGTHGHESIGSGPDREFPWPGWPDGRFADGLEPAIRRASDGGPDRLDERLAALGNGVVPLVAAHAFRTLAARMVAGA